MSEYIPLLQSLIWPVFIAIFLIFGRRYVLEFIRAIRRRIELGDPFKVGPGGITIGEKVEELNQEMQKTVVKISEVEKIATLAKKAADKKQWFLLGEVYRHQDSWEDAKYAYNEAIRLDPEYTSAFLGLAATFLAESKHRRSKKEKELLLNKALGYTETAIAKENDFAPAYLGRAAVKHALKRYSQTEIKADLEKAVGLDPQIKKFIANENEFELLKKVQWFQEIIQ